MLKQYYNRKNNHIILIYLYILSTLYIIGKPFLRQFSTIDEMIVLIVAIYSIGYLHIYKRKEVIVTFSILIAYLVYSLIRGVNKSHAAVYDFIIFLKPFICFIFAQQLKVKVSESARKYLKLLYLILGVYCLMIVPFIDVLYTNSAGYYPACIMCAVSYLYFSEKKNKDWIIALILLSPGLLTTRAKFYTEYLCFVFIAFFIKDKIKINIKWIIILSLLAGISIYFSWNKFYYYFIIGEDEGLARSLFYIRGFQLLKDFFPFGPGFGTFGTEAAAKFYSPLYHQYGMDFIWGLRKEDYGGSGHDFLKDTFYPALAQFGVVGIILYMFFWLRIWRVSSSLKINQYKLFLFIFFVELIQNIADNSFTGPLGVPCMMLLGFIVSGTDQPKVLKDGFYKNLLRKKIRRA